MADTEVERSPLSRRWLVVAIVLLVLYVVVMLLITVTPSPVNNGNEKAIDDTVRAVRDTARQSWFSYSKLELIANVIFYLPLGFLLGIVLPRRMLWLGAVLPPVLSSVIELSQALFLPQRTASVSDVITNTIGGWLGLLAAVWLLRMLRRRAARVV